MSYMVHTFDAYGIYCAMLKDFNTGDVAFFPKRTKLKGYQKCKKKR